MVAPLLVVLALAMVQVGTVVRDRVALSHAARVAARAAMVDPSPEAALRAAETSTNLERRRLTVAVSGDRDTGGVVTVTVTYRSPTRVPVVGRFLDDVTFSERLSARVE